MCERDKYSGAASVTQRMPREQAHFSLATWRNHEISASRRARVSEQSAQTCVEDRDLDALNYREIYQDINNYGAIDLDAKTMERSTRTLETMEPST